MPAFRHATLLCISVLCWLKCPTCSAEDDVDFFERKIRPVLIEYCYECHSSDSDEAAGGLLLDSHEGLRRGGETGPAVVPKNLSESLLLSAIEYRDLEMPPAEKLDDAIIADFRHWIKNGAVDPRDESMQENKAHAPVDTEQQDTLWSLQPISDPTEPNVDNEAWPISAIDRFIVSKLEDASLQPNPPALAHVRLRRLSFDLTGLPPSADIVTTVENWTEERFSEYTDKLLSSPEFGERWARHWLDVVRYGESAGSSRDVLMLYSWRYRDYVIDAFNGDVPYNEFIREQIAGDLLPANSEERRQRNLIATGLLAIGSKSLNGGNLALDIVDDQIDVVGKAFLGLTISCARCHDHKFDPIPTADYYALAGIFRSTKTFYGGSTKRPKSIKDKLAVYVPLGQISEETGKARTELERQLTTTQKKFSAAKKRLTAMEKRLPRDWKQIRKAGPTQRPSDPAQAKAAARVTAQIKQHATLEQQINELQDSVKELNQQLKTLPAPEFTFAALDVPKPRDWPIQIRGDARKNGEIVARGFLSCVDVSIDSPIAETESGRRQLAEWITHPDHPLTARVMVNRIWQHLFGRGFVETTNNFGISGSRPSHPALLDYLAHRFIHEHNWSVKSLIREIVLSRSYQMASTSNDAGREQDPSNQLLWRANRRRLEAEAIRDAMLTVSGQLKTVRPAGSLVQKIGEGEVGRNINTKPLEESFPHRSVYLPIIRGLLPEILKVFDFPDPANPTGERSITNVPTQSLFLMNSPFVLEQSKDFSARVVATSENSKQRIDVAWQMCFSRQPDAEEISEAERFLDKMTQRPDADRVAAWQLLCQSLISSAEFRFID